MYGKSITCSKCGFSNKPFYRRCKLCLTDLRGWDPDDPAGIESEIKRPKPNMFGRTMVIAAIVCLTFVLFKLFSTIK